MTRRAQANVLSAAPAAVISLVVIAVIIGVGSTVLDKVQDTQTVNSSAYNATADGLSGLNTFSDFQPTIAVIVVAVIVISLLIGGFAVLQRR